MALRLRGISLAWAHEPQGGRSWRQVTRWGKVSKAFHLGLVGFSQAHGNPKLGTLIDPYQFGR